MDRFVAIDFETADHGRDSACAVGLVRCEKGRIVDRLHRLIRPPRDRFVFTYIHGITWHRVRTEPSFAELWPEVREFIRGAEFLAAHNAPFDRGVLQACCQAADLAPPEHPFLCTVKLARSAWSLYPTNLPAVCRARRISLKHHEALSDAEACAQIVLQAMKEGVPLDALPTPRPAYGTLD